MKTLSFIKSWYNTDFMLSACWYFGLLGFIGRTPPDRDQDHVSVKATKEINKANNFSRTNPSSPSSSSSSYLHSPCPSGSSWWSRCPSWTAAWRGGWGRRCTPSGSLVRKPRPLLNPSGSVGGAIWRACGRGRWWDRPWRSSPCGRPRGCRPSVLWTNWAGSSCRSKDNKGKCFGFTPGLMTSFISLCTFSTS